MVQRVYTEKKQGFRNEANALFSDIINTLGILSLKSLRLINRYDVEGIDEKLFTESCDTVFSEPQTDDVFFSLPKTEGIIFAQEYLPGQYDQRADSASQCISIISQLERPTVKTAKVYILEGNTSAAEAEKIKKHIINPVESRVASLNEYETLNIPCEAPETIETVSGFIDMTQDELIGLIDEISLAMDIGDISFCQEYFKKEKRNPTITEIRIIDTYWSDHCRHTTFLTTADKVEFFDDIHKKAYNKYLDIRKKCGREKRPINLMDIATVGAKYLRQTGRLEKLDESEEINACTVKIDVKTDRGIEKWLLLFKNETHNHPTEIEPFGGAATCIGGAIRDPLSGRAYVYQAMRITGAADPTMPLENTIAGKLPQRKIVTTAAEGYSSYGNQIGLATGLVDEIYHEGYAAKRMEIGAVVGAAPIENVRRAKPCEGDVVILLGGRTGRDGCGGATGSSKSHSSDSLESCGAEVQKGNAPEERKLQRLFRNPKATHLIKRCNDFGAGGVCVAIGELADGLNINLDRVPKKYDGLDGTELAISESQERMAVVVDKQDASEFCVLAKEENLEATEVATVTASKRLIMRWRGNVICDLSREFLNSNGAEKHTEIVIESAKEYKKVIGGGFSEKYLALSADLNVCSKRGLSERFDSTIGAGTVLMPFGGKEQATPIQAMVAKIPVLKGDTDTCSVMSWGYNPYITEKSPYHGAYLAVTESLCKLVATGASSSETYLTFQEYFEKPGKNPSRWGKPCAALLGALSAQLDFECGAVGGKDSMSGSFDNLDVPPTLVSFAVTTADTKTIISPEFKKTGSLVYLIGTPLTSDNLPDYRVLRKSMAKLYELIKAGKVISAYTPTYGGVAEAVMKMCFGNKIGFSFSGDISESEIFDYSYGSFIVEADKELDMGTLLGVTTKECTISHKDSQVELNALKGKYDGRLENVFPTKTKENKPLPEKYCYWETAFISSSEKFAKPRVLIPVFPGTNCEYDTAKKLASAGANPIIFVIKNQSAAMIEESSAMFAKEAAKSQIIFIPGGFSGGDEPDGSGKFITAFFRNEAISGEVSNLLNKRDGLMCGICNGFQALIKLGLVPFGEIRKPTPDAPTLTFNTISRHQSRLVRTRIASNKSPWLMNTEPGEIYTVPISHGEGKFIVSDSLLAALAANGQIATQYVDMTGFPTYDVDYNPNGSTAAVEGITSPDGRVFGKMGHSERIGKNLYKNVEGIYDMRIFESAVKYFK